MLQFQQYKLLRRPFIDVGLAVLKVHNDGSLQLVDHKIFSRERQVEIEVELEAGRYVVVPRTTGALMNKPSSWDERPRTIFIFLILTALTDKDGHLTRAFEGVIEDIFRKFDLFIGRELSFDEFKQLYQCTGKPELTEFDFKTNFLEKFCSTSEGITVRGLKHWFQESIQRKGEDEVRAWLSNLGYDEHLFNSESRNFTLTFHCIQKFSVKQKNQMNAKDASRTQLDSLATCMVTTREIELNGPQKDFVTRKGLYQLVYSFSEETYGYSFVGINQSNDPIEIVVDAQKYSKDMLYLPRQGAFSKVIQPGEMEFILHAVADTAAESFVKKIEVTHRVLN